MKTQPSTHSGEPDLDLMIDLQPSTQGCCAPATSLRWSMAEADVLSAMLKALAHPVRLQMVELLHRMGGQVCVCDVEAHFDLTQPTISHHLKVLRQAGIITGEARGVWIYYSTRPEAMVKLRDLLGDLGAV